MSAPHAALLMVEEIDPFFASVVLLAHCDSEVANAWVNSCPRGTTITDPGGCALDTTAPKWGIGDAFTNAATGRLISASHADYNFDVNDWTIEKWVNPTTLNLDFNSIKVYYDQRNSSLTVQTVPIIAADNALGGLKYYRDSLEKINGGNVMVAGVYQHIAVWRISGTTRLGRNGVVLGSFADSATYVQSQITIGAAGNGAGAALGRYDDVRVTNGVGRYGTGSTYVVPWGPFPNK